MSLLPSYSVIWNVPSVIGDHSSTLSQVIVSRRCGAAPSSRV